MSIKGYKSQQALQNKLKGYSEEQSVDQSRYVTIQEIQGRKHALDTYTYGQYDVYTVDKTVEAGSNIRVIICTAHGASKADFIRFSNGTQCGVISTPDANTIITSVELDNDPTGLTFRIYRSVVPLYNPDGSTIITLPVGIAKEAKQDTQILQLADISDNTLATALNLADVKTKLDTIITQDIAAASSQQSLTLDNLTAQSFTPPIGCKWIKIHADDDNSSNLKVVFGGTVASSIIGEKFAPGRSEDYQASDLISVIAESASINQGVYFTYGV